MSEDREQLHERYMDAQLREQLGPETDISERVLHAVYAKPQRRVIPGPRKVATWRPLAAAAAVLIAAGVATFALVKILPNELRTGTAQVEEPAKQEAAQPRPAPGDHGQNGTPALGKGEIPTPAELLPKHGDPLEEDDPPPAEAQPEPDDAAPDDSVSSHPDPSDIELPHPNRKGWTDPPESWPDPKRPIQPPEGPAPDETAAKEHAVLVSGWKGGPLSVTRDGHKRTLNLNGGLGLSLLEGDRIETKDAADFTLVDGSLLRLDGDLTFAGTPEALQISLSDGVLYADTAAPLAVSRARLTVSIDGVAVIEERLHGMDVYCLSGRVYAGEAYLTAGFQSRLEKDGFGRERVITWEDVQREFKFLKDAPTRAMVVEELVEEPGKLFGGALAEGVLTGDVDSDTGIGFYLREPYTFKQGDVVRFRFRVGTACEMILQFGTVEDANWRHKMGGVKAGDWIEYDLPLIELYKTTDVAQRAAPGLSLKFFQLHPEEATARIEIDRFEIVHRP